MLELKLELSKHICNMKYIYLSFLVIFTHICPSFTQTIRTQKTPLLAFLYAYKNEIGYINTPKGINYVQISSNGKNIQQSLIKSKNGLFLLVDGTGQIYKATDTTNQDILFSRIDSTRDFGNNYLSINFSYNDTILSYGGYGFWRINGQLRYFNENEWGILKINEEYRVTNEAFCFLPKKSLLYTLKNITNNESLIDNEKESQDIIQLSLVTKENKIIGKLNPSFSFIGKSPSRNIVNIESLNGALFEDIEQREYVLINFEENKIFKLNEEKRNEIFNRTKNTIQTIFEINGMIYFTSSNNTFDSIKISSKDFILIHENIYSNSFVLKYRSTIIIMIFLISFVIIISIIYIKRKKIIKDLFIGSNKEVTIQNGITLNMGFSMIDHQLIELIYSKCQKGDTASVEDVNNCLGISKKTIEIQKRVRTEVINRLNHKFKIICDIPDNIINRIRSDEDRRYFRYTINDESYNCYKKGKNNSLS